jgi:hypothetical protein
MLGIADQSSQSILPLSEMEQQYSIITQPVPTQNAASQTDLVTELSHQFDVLTLRPAAVTDIVETSVKLASAPEIEDSMQIKMKSINTETASIYFESLMSSLHPIRLVRITLFNFCYEIPFFYIIAA